MKTMVIVGIAFAVLSSFVCLANIANSVLRMVRKRKGSARRTTSNIHVLSIVFSVMAYVFAGDVLGAWVFVPALIDPATLFLLAAPIILMRMRKQALNERKDR